MKIHDYNFNYYLSGSYQDTTGFHEKQDSLESAMAALDEIKEAEIEWRKMGEPENFASTVVKLVGLQIVLEVDSTYERREVA